MFSDRNLPPKTQHIKQLTLMGEVKKHKNSVFHAIKESKKSSEEKQKHYFFKKNKNKNWSINSELEAYCSAVCQLMATSEYVSSSRVYYDQNKQVIGVSSKAHLNFKSNYQDPLREEDILIDNLLIESERHRNIIKKENVILLEHYKNILNDAKSELNVSYVNTLYRIFDYFLNDYSIKNYFYGYRQKTDKYSTASLNSLINVVEARIDYIKSSKDRESTYQEEFKHMMQLLKSAEKLIEIRNKTIGCEDIVINEFEKLDTYFKEKNTQMDAFDLLPDEKSRAMYSQVKMKDLINYHRIKGLAVSLTTRFIFKEGDNNNSNMSKNGIIIDFGMTKQNISSIYSEYNIVDNLFRRPSKDAFKCTAHDIEHFPDIKDDSFYYWPTKETWLTDKLIELINQSINHCIDFPKSTEGERFKIIAELITKTYNDIFHDKVKDDGFIDHLTAVLNNGTLKIRSLLENVSENQLILEQQRKYLFNLIKAEFSIFIKTHKHAIHEIEKQYRKLLFDNMENLFTPQDNEVYKKLSVNPVFVFHKYKTLLKYLLTDRQMYKSIAELYISPEHEFLIDELVQDELDRIQEIRSIVIDLPDFKEFLIKYGNYACELIKNEFLNVKTKYNNRLKEKPYYESLVQSIDIGSIDDKFNKIIKKAGLSKHQDEKVSISHSQNLFNPKKLKRKFDDHSSLRPDAPMPVVRRLG